MIIEYEHPPGPEQVLRHMRARQVVLVRGGAADWPALHRQTIARLGERCPDATVFVRGGRYTFNVGGRGTVREFTDYLTGRTSLLGGNAAIDASVRAHGKDVPALYGVFAALAEFDPNLLEDYRFSEYIPEGSWVQGPSWWIGGADCETPLHFDLNSNTFVQIEGRKLLQVAPPDRAVNAVLAPMDVFEAGSIYSSVDIYRRPEVLEAVPGYAAIEVGPGDVVVLAPRVWHQLRSLTPSVSVQAFFDRHSDLRQRVVRGIDEVKFLLHLAGLRSVGRCVCHAIPGTPEVFANDPSPVRRWAARIGRLPTHGRSLAEMAGWDLAE